MSAVEVIGIQAAARQMEEEQLPPAACFICV
jgi:hypothetical protein